MTETETAISSWNARRRDAIHSFFFLIFRAQLTVSEIPAAYRTDVSSSQTEVSTRSIRDSCVPVADRILQENMRKRCVPVDDERKRKRLIGGLSWKNRPRGIVFKSEHETSFPLASDHTQVYYASHACAYNDTQARVRPCTRSSASGKIANRLDDRLRTSRRIDGMFSELVYVGECRDLICRSRVQGSKPN